MYRMINITTMATLSLGSPETLAVVLGGRHGEVCCSLLRYDAARPCCDGAGNKRLLFFMLDMSRDMEI